MTTVQITSPTTAQQMWEIALNYTHFFQTGLETIKKTSDLRNQFLLSQKDTNPSTTSALMDQNRSTITELHDFENGFLQFKEKLHSVIRNNTREVIPEEHIATMKHFGYDMSILGLSQIETGSALGKLSDLAHRVDALACQIRENFEKLNKTIDTACKKLPAKTYTEAVLNWVPSWLHLSYSIPLQEKGLSECNGETQLEPTKTNPEKELESLKQLNQALSQLVEKCQFDVNPEELSPKKTSFADVLIQTSQEQAKSSGSQKGTTTQLTQKKRH